MSEVRVFKDGEVLAIYKNVTGFLFKRDGTLEIILGAGDKFIIYNKGEFDSAFAL